MKTFENRQKEDIVSLYIYHYQTERHPKPVLIGFNLEVEKEFFQHFISVEAIGPLKAIKAMDMPVREIARAIEEKNVAKLKNLKGIGNRTAQKIVATLEGKVGKFALISKDKEPSSSTPAPIENFEQLVLDVLVNQLGHKVTEARKLIAEALRRNTEIATPEELFEEVYRIETL
jgi:Holliday junction DNA helicase RuvA